MNKAAIYCRVSTEGQEQDGTSLQTQLEAINHWNAEAPPTTPAPSPGARRGYPHC